MMLKRFFLVTGILLVALGGLCPAARATTSAAGESASGVTPSQTLLTISCPSVTVCYAGGEGGTILMTRNGGAAWQAASVPSTWTPDVTAVPTITCSSTQNCFAWLDTPCDGGASHPLLHTADGGLTWSQTPFPGCALQLACAGPVTCYAVTDRSHGPWPEFYVTRDAGRHWGDRGTITPDNRSRVQVNTLTCPTPDVCYAGGIGTVARITGDGRSWTVDPIVPRHCPVRNSPFVCPSVNVLACPSATTCYAGSYLYGNGRFVTAALTTRDGFRTHATRPILGLNGIAALSCPGANTCGALETGTTGRFASTSNGGVTWHISRVSAPYPWNTIACPTLRVCYAAGFLGRLMGTGDGGAGWRDLIPARFISGTYGPTQPLHTSSSPFTATGPWHLAVGKGPATMAANGRPVPTSCRAIDSVTVYVRNTANAAVAGPIAAPTRFDRVARKTLSVTGTLHLDVVSRCSTWTARVDGVAGGAAPALRWHWGGLS